MKKYISEIVARDVRFLGGKGGDGGERQESRSAAPVDDGPPPDDDIPFIVRTLGIFDTRHLRDVL